MQGTKQNILKKQLCAIGWMVLACYILRLWPFILVLLAVGMSLALYALVKQGHAKEAAPPPAPLPVNNSAVKLEEPPQEEPVKTDYSLLAFQWADAIAPSLKGRCAEAACHGITKVILPEAELPVRESWPAICEELRRAGFPPAHTAAEGIWLDLTKEEMKRHERNA